jgi:hypothetical protein
MTDLLARLSVAEVGSRELDWAIHSSIAAPYWSGCEWNEFGYVDVDGHPPHPDQITVFKDGRSFYNDMPRYTTSLDAALALAERTVTRRGPIDLSICGSAQVVIHHADPCGSPLASSFGKTPALALCIAILKATEAGQ